MLPCFAFLVPYSSARGTSVREIAQDTATHVRQQVSHVEEARRSGQSSNTFEEQITTPDSLHRFHRQLVQYECLARRLVFSRLRTWEVRTQTIFDDGENKYCKEGKESKEKPWQGTITL